MRLDLQSIGVLGVAALVGLSGCSLLLGASEEQCKTDGDCTARGFENAVCDGSLCVAIGDEPSTGGSSSSGEPPATTSTGSISSTSDGSSSSSSGFGDGPWDCVGHVMWEEEDEGVPARVGLHFTNSSFQDFEGATLNACRPLDLECAEPLSTSVSDADGVAFADVYFGYDGYFRAPPPRSQPEALPFIIYAYPPPFEIETVSRGGDVLFIDPPTLAGLAGLSGTEIVPDTGLIFFTAFDCLDQLAADVSISISPVGSETVVAYLDGGFPSSKLSATVDEGQGAIINVPPGLIELTGTSLERGLFFQSTVLVEANSVTGVAVVPSPI